MKVNMTPNPLDVVTIHASQNDGEARQWEFELHNNGELIDTSEVTEQMFFKSYKGGTEQLLPENTSTPTTSPFKGDIKYPQGLLTDQEFTYRQSPTESDGLAKITDIKGNTLVWNQLVQNGNFADSSLWSGQFTTVSISNNIANVTLTGKGTYVALRQSIFASVTGHKYFVTATFKSAKKTAIGFYLNGQGAYLDGYDIQANTLTKVSALINGGESGGFNIYVSRKNELDVGDVVQVSNVMLFDLTQMGLDITEPSEFTSLFPLSYYSYNQGSLLSFMGNGIKTVGFNQWNEEWELGTYLNINGSKYNSTSKIRNVNHIRVLPNTSYYYIVGMTSTDEDGVFFYDGNMNFIRREPIYHGSSVSISFTTPANCLYVNFSVKNTTYNNDICINISDPSKNGTYEPYTSSTLSLPISTYFPNGMKSAGSVYDELTESKAITRIGSLKGSDIQGSVSSAVSSGGFHYAEVNGLGSKASGQGISNMLPIKNYDAWSSTVPCIQIRSTEGSIRIYGAFTTFQEFQTQYASLVIYYELATPTETSFTTASLVTENGEIPLSNDDGVLIGKCTEELSENPGFIDAKIKLSDSDGDVYSNKLQLHVERSPQ